MDVEKAGDRRKVVVLGSGFCGMKEEKVADRLMPLLVGGSLRVVGPGWVGVLIFWGGLELRRGVVGGHVALSDGFEAHHFDVLFEGWFGFVLFLSGFAANFGGG